MAWQDTLVQLREELAEARAERLRRAEEEEAALKQEREKTSQLAKSLGLQDLLADMNATLLDGEGKVETILSWETIPDEDTDDDGPGFLDDDEDEGDIHTTLLSWQEAGECEIAIDLESTEDGVVVQVNGVEIRPEREALEQALVEAFRDELSL